MISFLSVFPPYRGGIAKFSDSLYHQLQLQTDVRSYSFKKLYPDLLFPGTSQTVEGDKPDYASRILHPYSPTTWNKTADLLLAENPDCVLYSYWHPFFAPALSRVLSRCKRKKPSIKIAGIAHNILPHDYFPFKKNLAKSLLNKTDVTILLSAQTENDFRTLNPSCDHKKLFHPVYRLDKPTQSNSELRSKYGFNEDDQLVLFMGLVRDYKGVDLLIEAFNEIHKDGEKIKPFIVGEFYTDKQKLLEQIHKDYRQLYTIKDEFVSEKTMSEILSISDLLVLPYKKATQSGVLANAVYFTLPALVSDQPGLSEHIIHRHNGLIFKTGDALDLKNNIQTYFEESLQKKLSHNLQHLKEDLSWEKFTRNLIRTIENLQENSFA